jgi:branched-chain amino acid transport system permease protein
MTPQVVMDGLIAGSMIGLGAIGVTLTYSILRFANFAHGEFVTWGAYGTLAITGAIGFAAGSDIGAIGPFSFGWPLILAGFAAAILTGLLALALDLILFARLRAKGTAIIMVMASFGASMALRSLCEFFFTSAPRYYSRDIQIAIEILPGIRMTPDQLFMIGLTAALVTAVHLLMTRTTLGRSMRAVSENPALSSVVGIDVDKVVRATWLIGGALAAAAGVMSGIVVQIRPFIGFDLLLPLFAAAILGGIGSVPGAILGGLIVGLAEAAAVPLIGANFRAAVAFLLLTAVLLLRPAGIFGVRE